MFQIPNQIILPKTLKIIVFFFGAKFPEYS